MRIAILTNEYPPHIYGGAGVHVEYLTRELARVEDGNHSLEILLPPLLPLVSSSRGQRTFKVPSPSRIVGHRFCALQIGLPPNKGTLWFRPQQSKKLNGRRFRRRA